MSPSLSSPSKRFLSYSDLVADLRLSRNLLADKSEIIQRLHSVNYYRLTGCLYSFRETVMMPDGSRGKGENYRSGTTLDLVWQFYLFDHRLAGGAFFHARSGRSKK